MTTWPSIVPPPSGGGYLLVSIRNKTLKGAFNCAAPFRGRLLDCDANPGHPSCPSIVPPPSGGGYID